MVSADPQWNDDLRDLAPNQSMTLEFPVTTSIFGPGWFGDAHFEQPGSWRLQIALVPDGMKTWEFNEAGSTAPLAGELAAKGYLSPPITFTLTQPQGEDVRACELVSERENRSGCPMQTTLARHNDLAVRILKEFPHSSYAPYLLLSEPGLSNTLDRIRMCEKAIAALGNSPVADWYRWLLAAVHDKATFDNDTPADAVKAHEKAALAIWEQLTRSKHVALRKGAAKKLKEAAESSSDVDD